MAHVSSRGPKGQLPIKEQTFFVQIDEILKLTKQFGFV